MWSFLISLAVLILGYFLYGKFVEKVVCPDPTRITPAISKADGIDYVALPNWKVYMIQFLNIAGTGPIFGAIMGAKFGPSCYLWIVLGSIFAGGVHDYLCGMLSIRNDGAALPGIVGKYLGTRARGILMVFSLVLLLLVGVVFVYSPALILGDMAAVFEDPKTSIMFWVAIIFVYYIVATLLPIDKIIGKIYPLFAVALLFMAIGLGICLVIKWPAIREFWDGLGNRGPSVGVQDQPIWPCLFITVACGALSGFHSTQTPIMARCLTNEKMGRPIFYGAMITEGIVALVWAAVSSYFFFDSGMQEVGATSAQAPVVVTSVAKSWLGIIGGIFAILGVVAAPLSSGDTAFRSARLILAERIGIDQKQKKNRLIIGIPMFILAALLLYYNISYEDGFNKIWRYFGLANQALASFTLWTITAYLSKEKAGLRYLISFIPAVLMTSVCVTYLFTDKTGFHITQAAAPYIAAATALICLCAFYFNRGKRLKKAN